MTIAKVDEINHVKMSRWMKNTTTWGRMGKPCKLAWRNAIRFLYAILINPFAALTYQKPDYNFCKEVARITVQETE